MSYADAGSHRFLHKLSTKLVSENQAIYTETLAVKNMMANHKLAKAIADCGWGEFLRQLEYKAEWHGRKIGAIDRWFPSSKRCHQCGHIVDKLPLEIREWTCPSCGSHHMRDENAAKNILGDVKQVRKLQTTLMRSWSNTVSYTHLTLPTIYSV